MKLVKHTYNCNAPRYFFDGVVNLLLYIKSCINQSQIDNLGTKSGLSQFEDIRTYTV
jgi:hypothetical protein